MKKLANWQLTNCNRYILIAIIENRYFHVGFEISFIPVQTQHKCIGQQLKVIKQLFTFNSGMSQIFLLIQFLHPFEKFCLWALTITINIPLQSANCQFVNFVHLEKGLLHECNATCINVTGC